MPMALVTSSTKESVSFKTQEHSWINLIDVKIYGDNPGLRNGKPNPDPFILAAKKLQVNPKLCWAVEDSEAGIKSAIASGCKVWKLTNTLTTNENVFNTDVQAQPILINKLATLIMYLEKIISKS